MPSDWVVIAHLVRPRGIRGELSGISLTGHPERYDRLLTVSIDGSEYTLERVWYHKNQPIFKFRGVDSITGAEPLAGKNVCVPASERFLLPEDEYYYADLMDCRVIDAGSGRVIGTVTGWQELGGPVVLELDHGKILIPYARSILSRIDVEAREIVASLPDGLEDLNT